MLTDTGIIEGNRNCRWALLHQACQLSAKAGYTRYPWGISVGRHSGHLLARINHLIVRLRQLRYFDRLSVI